MTDPSSSGARTCALVGPGRAGSAVGIALVAAGWRVTRVAGRSTDAASVVAAAARFDAEAAAIADAGRGVALVVIATPDDAIGPVASEAAAGLEPGALVVHLAGARGLDALRSIADARSDVEIGALHPLQTIVTPETGAARLPGAWAAVAGSPRVRDLASELGMTPFTVRDADRGAYHAAASVASNHLVALLGQVERIAGTADVPLAAFEPLVRATIDNCFALGPVEALTGPVARGDIETVLVHLRAVDVDEQRAYRALAAAAAQLAGHDDDALRRALA